MTNWMERLASDQALFLSLNKADHLGEKQGVNLSFILSFLNGACLLMTGRGVFVLNIWDFRCIVYVAPRPQTPQAIMLLILLGKMKSISLDDE